MNNNKVFFAIAGLTFVMAAGSGIKAHADNVQFLNDNGSIDVTITYLSPKTNTIQTEGTAAGDYQTLVNGVLERTFCTDVSDNIYNGESWTATKAYTSGTGGLSSTWYGGNISQQNIYAIDYLIAHDSTTPSAQTNGDAQVAVWDLSLNGGVTKTGNTYNWSSVFSATGGVNISDVYQLEQTALEAKGPSGSFFENAGPEYSGRPQDLAFAPVPESSSVVAFCGMALMGGVSFLRLRRRAQKA